MFLSKMEIPSRFERLAFNLVVIADQAVLLACGCPYSDCLVHVPGCDAY